MNEEKVKQTMVGDWVSISPEIRPSTIKNADGSVKPFYLSRSFNYNAKNEFALEITNFADPFGKSALSKMSLKGNIVWQGEHPIAAGAQKVEFVADQEYLLTPLMQPFADLLNKVAGSGYASWEINKAQSVLKKEFALFGLAEGQIFHEYDLVYILGDFLFWGARNIDGRGFDTEENRPTNLQIPMRRKI